MSSPRRMQRDLVRRVTRRRRGACGGGWGAGERCCHSATWDGFTGENAPTVHSSGQRQARGAALSRATARTVALRLPVRLRRVPRLRRIPHWRRVPALGRVALRLPVRRRSVLLRRAADVDVDDRGCLRGRRRSRLHLHLLRVRRLHPDRIYRRRVVLA